MRTQGQRSLQKSRTEQSRRLFLFPVHPLACVKLHAVASGFKRGLFHHEIARVPKFESAKQVTHHGRFQVATKPASNGKFMAWGKKGSILSDDPRSEPGIVVCAIADTREDAREKVLIDLEVITK